MHVQKRQWYSDMPRKAAKVKDKWREKVWLTVMAPKAFGSVEVAEIPVTDVNKATNRTVEATLFDLLKQDPQHYNIKLYFKIDKIEGDRAYTTFTQTRINSSKKSSIRKAADMVLKEKASSLSYDQFVQEVVLGKLGADVFAEAKKVTAIRQLNIRKTKLISMPEMKEREEALAATTS